MAAPQFMLTTPTGIGSIVGDHTGDGVLDSSMYAGAKVTFTSNIKPGVLIAVPGEGLRAVNPVVVRLDSDGKLNGSAGIPLLADDPALGLDSPLQWRVSVTGWTRAGQRLHVNSWWINARAEGEVLDLKASPPVAESTANLAVGVLDGGNATGTGTGTIYGGTA